MTYADLSEINRFETDKQPVAPLDRPRLDLLKGCMLGFSIQKLLFTAAAIALVWYGFKWLGRMQAQKKALARERARRMAREGAGKGASTKATPEVEDMIECAACGSFVAATGTKNCGKPDCPYPG